MFHSIRMSGPRTFAILAHNVDNYSNKPETITLRFLDHPLIYEDAKRGVKNEFPTIQSIFHCASIIITVNMQ